MYSDWMIGDFGVDETRLKLLTGENIKADGEFAQRSATMRRDTIQRLLVW